MLEAVFAQRPEYEQAAQGMEPVGRVGTADEVAGLVVWCVQTQRRS